MAARQPHRVAERQPCRGVNSLRPHPYGPHTPAHPCILATGHRSTRKPTHLFWPEAIAARWSCGPHVTPASNRRRRCRAGVSHAPTARALRRCAAYVAPTSSLLPILLCLPQPDHFLLAGSAGLGLPTVTKFARRAYTIDSPTVPTQGGSVGWPAPTPPTFEESSRAHTALLLLLLLLWPRQPHRTRRASAFVGGCVKIGAASFA
jgi:hypothetical protein